jgi:hypothetical protein
MLSADDMINIAMCKTLLCRAVGGFNIGTNEGLVNLCRRQHDTSLLLTVLKICIHIASQRFSKNKVKNES